MASIDGLGGIRADGPRRPATLRQGATPAWPGVSEPEAAIQDAGQTTEAAPAPALDGLLALQESLSQPSADAFERDRPGRQHGRRLLAALAGLQQLVLAGGDPAAVLSDLRTLADVTPEAADPALAATLAAIRLRVRVELARRGE